jgi:hypothetical protein
VNTVTVHAEGKGTYCVYGNISKIDQCTFLGFEMSQTYRERSEYTALSVRVVVHSRTASVCGHGPVPGPAARVRVKGVGMGMKT